MEIKYIINNEKSADLLILPGWSFDYKIFEKLNAYFNLIVFDKFDRLNFINEFRLFFNKFTSARPLFIAAWSMGGFICCDLIKNNIIKKNTKNIFLISASIKFDKQLTENLFAQIKKNKNDALNNFYKKMFLGDKRQYNFFLENFYDYYINIPEQYLLDELEYLKESVLDYSLLKNFKLTLIHSEKDYISPITEYTRIKEQTSATDCILAKYTHVPFFYDEVISAVTQKIHTP